MYLKEFDDDVYNLFLTIQMDAPLKKGNNRCCSGMKLMMNDENNIINEAQRIHAFACWFVLKNHEIELCKLLWVWRGKS